MRNCRIPLIISLFVIWIVSACAHVPRESVYLSEELTTMIASARASHLELVDEYMAERRQRVEAFMEETWIPDFMERFVTDSNVLRDIERAGTAEEKGRIMLEFADAASREISGRRASLMDALDEIEKALKEAINAHYDDMIMVNQALTAHLRSAAEVTATREELLTRMKIRPEKIVPLDKINTSLEKIISYEGKVDDLSEIVGKVKGLIGKEE